LTPKYWHTLLVAAASLVAAVLAAAVLIQQKRSNAQVEIEAAHSELELALATLSVRMSSMARAMEQASDLTPSRYSGFYGDVTQSATRVPERAMAFMPEIASLSQVEAAAAEFAPDYQAAGYPAFRLFPEAPTEALFPVVMVEPGPSRPNVFGYNMGSSIARLAAGREALAAGVMTISAPIVLTQDAGLADVSFLLLYPVYFADPEPATGASRGLLAAGVTPAALFDEHLTFYDRHIVEVVIGIGSVALPVTLSGAFDENALRVPLVRDMTMPDIRTSGFDVPFRASVFYVPQMVDFAVLLAVAALTALVGLLVVNTVQARAASQEALEAALRAKEAELSEAYRIKARSQRVESLGRLVGGVAHDFNNILSVILGNLELLKERGAQNEDAPLLEDAVSATHRGAHLTRQLLSVGRKSHLQPKPFDVARALEDSAAMLARVLPESIELTTASAAGLWTAQADPDGLQNAVLNLAINARDAMQGRGKLVLEAVNSRVTHDYVDDRLEDELAPGRYVAISVTDTGPGMPAEVLERAFEPFFTTKHATDGSGLGLPSVLGFCRQSGGTCRIYSELRVGTTVQILLPVSEPALEEPETAPVAEAVTRGEGRILLAEDEDAVARVVQAHLEAAGYTVTRVPTADAAWAQLEGGEVFDLLITDIVMPGRIQGAELARLVEVERPDMALLLISGYPQEAAIEGNGVALHHAVLAKPVPKPDLLRMVERLLSARGRSADGAGEPG
jgi:signal transduction histidine kinase/ActR/RegA family two-component response regulator